VFKILRKIIVLTFVFLNLVEYAHSQDDNKYLNITQTNYQKEIEGHYYKNVSTILCSIDEIAKSKCEEDKQNAGKKKQILLLLPEHMDDATIQAESEKLKKVYNNDNVKIELLRTTGVDDIITSLRKFLKDLTLKRKNVLNLTDEQKTALNDVESSINTAINELKVSPAKIDVMRKEMINDTAYKNNKKFITLTLGLIAGNLTYYIVTPVLNSEFGTNIPAITGVPWISLSVLYAIGLEYVFTYHVQKINDLKRNNMLGTLATKGFINAAFFWKDELDRKRTVRGTKHIISQLITDTLITSAIITGFKTLYLLSNNLSLIENLFSHKYVIELMSYSIPGAVFMALSGSGMNILRNKGIVTYDSKSYFPLWASLAIFSFLNSNIVMPMFGFFDVANPTASHITFTTVLLEWTLRSGIFAWALKSKNSENGYDRVLVHEDILKEEKTLEAAIDGLSITKENTKLVNKKDIHFDFCTRALYKILDRKYFSVKNDNPISGTPPIAANCNSIKFSIIKKLNTAYPYLIP